MPIITPQQQTPFAQNNSGRIPLDTPVADGLERAGNALFNAGANIETRKRTQQMAEARVTAVERLGDLRVQYEQSNDLLDMGDRFKADASAIGDEISAGLPKHMQEEFNLDYRQVLAPQSRAISRRGFALEKDEALARLNQNLRIYADHAARAPDEESRNQIQRQAAADIGAAADAGYLGATQADGLTEQTFTSSTASAAILALDEDPEGLLQRLEAGEFNGLDAAQRSRLTVQARQAARANAARNQKAVILEEKAAEKDRIARVGDAVNVLEAGLPFEGLSELLAETSGTDEGRQLRATIAAVQTEGNFVVLTPEEQASALSSLRSRGTSDADDVDRLDRLEKISERTVTELREDQLSYAANRGILELGAVDFNDPASVSRRVAQSETLWTDYNAGQDLRYFTNGERDAFRAQVQNADPDAQLQVAIAIVTSFGDRAPRALAEVGADDPLFQMAGQLVAETKDIEVARGILQGRQLLKDGDGAKVKQTVRGTVRSQFSEIFPPGAGRKLATLIDAADAHFAQSGLSLSSELSEEELRDAYAVSVQKVLGQSTFGGTAFGGVQEVNGRNTLLPKEYSAEVVEDTLQKVTVDNWISASISGNQPLWGGQPLDGGDAGPGRITSQRARQLRNLKLLSVGGGSYLVGVERADGEIRYLQDSATRDGLFYVDLRQLVENANKGASK